MTKSTSAPEVLADILDNTAWVQNLKWKQVETLATYFELYTIPENVELFAEGSTEIYLGLIVAGAVKVYKADARGKRKHIALIGRGKTLGEMSLIDGAARSAAAVSAVEVTLLVLTEAHFARLCEERPGLGLQVVLNIALLMSKRLRQTSGRLIEYLEDE